MVIISKNNATKIKNTFAAQRITPSLVVFDPSDPQVGLASILVNFPQPATYPGN